MNTKSVVSSILAASIFSSTFAFARDNHFENNQPRVMIQQQNQYYDNQQNDHHNRYGFNYDNRNTYNRHGNIAFNNNNRRSDNQGYNNRYHRQANDRGFHRGERIPAQYFHNRYVMNDWRNYQLNEPPRGYRWMNIDGDFILASMTTGIIANIIWNGISR